jgi:hypothetical protein
MWTANFTAVPMAMHKIDFIIFIVENVKLIAILIIEEGNYFFPMIWGIRFLVL